jgi:hypothetical protein
MVLYSIKQFRRKLVFFKLSIEKLYSLDFINLEIKHPKPEASAALRGWGFSLTVLL